MKFSALSLLAFALLGCGSGYHSQLDQNSLTSQALVNAKNLTYQRVSSATGSQSFTVAPASGYTLSATVGGNCPQGQWSGTKYTVPTTANCSVNFEAYQTISTLSQTANFLAPLTAIPQLAPGGNTWYVDAVNGSDSNSGLTQASAFQTISQAYLPWKNASFKGGDVVVVSAGTYSENIRICDDVNNGPSSSGSCWSSPATNFGGTAVNPTIFMAAPCTGGVLPGTGSCARPKIIGGYSAVEYGGGVFQLWASYVRISGFEITSTDTSSTSSSQLSACVTGSGVTTTDSTSTVRPVVHHLSIDNNVMHDCGAAGVNIAQSDYVTIQNNKIYNTAFFAPNDTSGISVGAMIDFDSIATYHVLITGNVLYNNLVKVPINFTRYGVAQNCPSSTPNCATDGNGIILDTQYSYPNSQGATLVFGNISYNNGARGLSISGHSYVDVINNTFYFNGQPNASTYQLGSTNPEISINKLDGITPTNLNIYNNLIVPRYAATQDPSAIYNPAITFLQQQPTILLYLVSNTSIRSNILSVANYTPGSSSPQTLDSSNLISSPAFTNAATDPTVANFTLATSSPAMRAGLSLPFDTTDLNWMKFYNPISSQPNANRSVLPNMGAVVQ